MSNTKKSTSNPFGITPPANDIKSMQAHRRGLPAQGDENCPGTVVPFPMRPKTPTEGAHRIRTHRGNTGSDSATAEPDRFGTGPEKARARQATGAHATVGVLMPSLSLTRPISGRRPNDIGVVTHAVIAMLAPHVPNMKPVLIPERVLDCAASLVSVENVSDRRALITAASGHANTYLRRLYPTGWELLGVEFHTGQGRVDLAYRNPETGMVMFDEIKTTRSPLTEIPKAWVEQTSRYLASGVESYQEKFCGVRLLPLGSLDWAFLLMPDDTRVLIRPTNEEPLRLTDRREFFA